MNLSSADLPKTLKINFLTAFSHTQGTYFRWHNIGIGLIALGHQVTVYCVDYGDDVKKRKEVRDGIEYYIIPGCRGKQYLGTFNHPITAINRLFVNYKSCDILHVFQSFLTIYLPWQFCLKKRSKVTIFDWDDLWAGGLYSSKKNTLLDKWNYTLVEYFEKKIPSLNLPMTTCSQYLKDLVHKSGNNDCHILHNGFWPYIITEKKEARQKLKLHHDAYYVGFMGRTTKELSWCFEALEACHSNNLNVRFAVCGPNPQELKEISPLALQYTDYLGSLTPLETRDFAASLDLGLLPMEDNSFNNSRFPIKLSEYMAAGIPVLCSEVGEMKHYTEKYSWVIGAGTDKEAWIKKFVETVRLVATQNCNYKVNMNEIENDLSWTGISKKVEKLYLANSKL